MSATVEKRLALVGTGTAAARYIEVLPGFPELVPCGVVEPDSRASAQSPFHELRHFERVHELLRRGLIPDIAIVCTPPGDHVDDVLPLLQAGVDVIVHPPLASRPLEAEHLLEMAECAGRELTTATPERLSACLRSAADVVRSGRIGPLRQVECTLSTKCDARSGWHRDPTRSGGGVWMQLGARAIDVLEHFLGPIQRIRILELRERQGAGVEDEVVAETDHGEAGLGRVRVSWNEQLSSPLARLVGELGELALGSTQVILRADDGETVLCPGYDEREAYAAVLREHLRRRCIIDPPIDSGPDTVSWIEAAYRSVRDQRWQQ